MTAPMIQLRSLSRTFGTTHAVRDLSLVVPRGLTLGLLGMNGAGKSTTLRMLMGLLKPTAGEALIDGREVIRYGPELRQQIGYVPERPTVYSWMRVQEAMQFCKSLQPGWDDQTADKLLQMFRLDRRKPVRALSRGMTTKLHLLLALAHRPDTLILDEPLSGLDPIVRDEFLEGVLAGICEHDCTVVLSSHQVDDVQKLADRVAFLHEGELVLEGETQALLNDVRRMRVTLADSDVAFTAPRGTILCRRERRVSTVTVRACDEQLLRETSQQAGVVQVDTDVLTLTELFKDVVRATETAARC